MATTDATPKFHNPDIRPVPNPPDFHHEITVSSPSHDGLPFWQFMVAGSVAGCVEHMAMFPVDTIKTRMQALGSCPIRFVGFHSALQSILKTDGPAGLYRGIAAMGLGAGPAHAVYFSVYEFCKKAFSGGNRNNHLAHAASGVCATVTSDAIFTPMDMVKQRLQLSGGGGVGAYRGVWDCVKRVLREEGFGAFYASYKTTIIMNAPYTAVHFATYEAAKRTLMEISPESATDERLIVHATAGAAAGALAAVVTTPLDVVKTQLQCQRLPVHLRAEAAECMSFEATSRIRDPIYGCAGIITQLLHQIIQAEREAAKIQAKITFYSAQVHVDPAWLTESHYAQKQERTLQTSISNPSFGESRGGEFDDGPIQ